MAGHPASLGAHPALQVLYKRRDIPSTSLSSKVRRQTIERSLYLEDGIELADGFERERRDHDRLAGAGLARDVGKNEELTTGVAPAGSLGDRPRPALGLVERVEPGIGIGL